MRAFMMGAGVLSIAVVLAVAAYPMFPDDSVQDLAKGEQEKVAGVLGAATKTPQEKPLRVVEGAKKRTSLVEVGDKVRFVSANGSRVYDGVFTVQDGFHVWVLVGNDEGRSWWVNLGDVEGFEIVP